ncbi:alpha/beta fold hydrolase [Coleofasciculus sp. F4-SAH-05]|uniref:alpha/beta fold hydrolase n=1 Tax=Coleofasciculus sp. F4-SAH-05 TaxID=3069525 RepID=UPI0032F6D6E4
MNQTPDCIIFAQHGWADTHHAIAALAKSLATPQTHLVTPNLGWLKTWWRIEPLIQQVEGIATETITQYPDTPIRIIGHSMGGLIWLEILNQHPEWWSQIESFVLVASPIGGADLARIIDPFSVRIGIAGALGINRRQIAQSIAKKIPTLVIAGDRDRGSDGTITVESTKFSRAKFVSIPNLAHAQLKNHPTVIGIIREFWANPTITNPSPLDFTAQLIEHLQSIHGMTDAHPRDFSRSQPYITLANGFTIRIWTSPLQVDHIFVANPEGECLYSCFVGWMHRGVLHQALAEIRNL